MSNYMDHKRIVTKIPKIGRPKKFDSVEDLEKAIEEYFSSCFIPVYTKIKKTEIDPETGNKISGYEEILKRDEDGEIVYEQVAPFTITGLAVALDTTRETLLDYENKPENAAFSDTIKKAKQIIHNYAEDYLFTGKNQTGAIFNLKNNYGWVDRTETDITSKNKEISASVVTAKADKILEKDNEND